MNKTRAARLNQFFQAFGLLKPDYLRRAPPRPADELVIWPIGRLALFGAVANLLATDAKFHLFDAGMLDSFAPAAMLDLSQQAQIRIIEEITAGLCGVDFFMDPLRVGGLLGSGRFFRNHERPNHSLRVLEVVTWDNGLGIF